MRAARSSLPWRCAVLTIASSVPQQSLAVRIHRHLRRAILGVTAAAISGLGPAQAFASSAVRAAGPGSPSQFAGAFDATPDPSIGRLFTIAHNAGDSASSTAAAVAHNAGAIEIDVMLNDGRLLARHNAMAPVIGDWLPPGRRLDAVWAGLGSRTVLLDLKSTSPGALRLVAREISRHPSSRVLVSTPSLSALSFLQREAPRATRLLTVGSDRTLDRLLGDPGMLSIAQGVSIRQSMLTAEKVSALHRAGLFVQAWTVNTIGRLDQLNRWAVDGITTDNLTVLDAVSRAGMGAAARAV